MNNRVRTLTGTFVAGAAAVLLAGGPASAGTDIYVDTSDPWNSAAAGFAADGEIFTVCDNRADGKRASGRIVWIGSDASHNILLEDSNGSGNSCARKDLSIAEGIKVTVEICLRDGAKGTRHHCATRHGRS